MNEGFTIPEGVRNIYIVNCWSTGWDIGYCSIEHPPKKFRRRVNRDLARIHRRPSLIHNGRKPR